MKDYPTLHLDTNQSRGTSFFIVLHFTVTVRSSTMSITRTIK